MTTKSCTRKHTLITSIKQRGFFGAELARLRTGKKRKTSMPEEELVRHLRESKGKKLPLRAAQRYKKRYG